MLHTVKVFLFQLVFFSIVSLVVKIVIRSFYDMSSSSVIVPHGVRKCVHGTFRSHGLDSMPWTKQLCKAQLFLEIAKDERTTTVKHMKIEVFHYFSALKLTFWQQEHCKRLGLDSRKSPDIVTIIVRRHLHRNWRRRQRWGPTFDSLLFTFTSCF